MKKDYDISRSKHIVNLKPKENAYGYDTHTKGLVEELLDETIICIFSKMINESV